MYKYISILCLIMVFHSGYLLSQENKIDDIAVEEEEEESKDKKTNVNIDAKMLYGQYNNILWSGSITQNFDNFTYQLNSDFKRSNDFGIRNSSFHENEIGFTAKADVVDPWKLMPEVSVNNDSHGMYRNPIYSREEKDKVILKFKNDIQPMPTRWDINIGGAYYTHRLESPLAFYMSSSNFYKADAEFGWEYIWSAANKLRFGSKVSQYFYSDGSDDDTFVYNEFLWNFKISEYIMVNLGPVYIYNRDYGHFPSGKVNISTASLKYVSIELTYVYDLFPFLPEEFYYKQKFMKPDYGLPPGKGHNAGAKLSIDVTNNSDKKFYIKKFELKGEGSFETNTDYLNYISIRGNVLTSLPINVLIAKGEGSMAMGLAILSSYLELGAQYQYCYTRASNNITYLPVHVVGGYIRLEIDRLEVEFKNTLKGSVYVDPYYNRKLSSFLLGTVTMQFRVLDSFYLYAEMDNVYNSKYSLRSGYPEPGRTIIGGIRIII